MYPNNLWMFMGRGEDKDYPALVTWIDRQHRSGMDQKWGVWGGAVGGLAGLCGALTGTLAGVLGRENPNALVPYIVSIWTGYVIVTLVSLGFMVRRSIIQARANSTVYGPNWKMTRQALLVARWQGRLGSTLGHDTAKLLNSAAEYALRASAAFGTEAWRSISTGFTGQVRENAEKSIEAAMSQLIMMAMQGGGQTVMNSIVSDLRTLANEAENAAIQTQNEGFATSSLRESISELREIRQATEEANNSLRLGG